MIDQFDLLKYNRPTRQCGQSHKGMLKTMYKYTVTQAEESLLEMPSLFVEA